MRSWTMRRHIWLVFSLTFLLSHAQTIQWGIQRRPLNPDVQRRSAQNATWEEIINNEKGKGGYFATVVVGNPGQDLVLQLDTASSDVWLPFSGAAICNESTTGCNLGSYDPDESDTFRYTARDQFQISYFDQSFSSGDYFEDSFEIGGAVLKNLTMGLGRQTNIPYGLVGVGYAINEASLATMGEMYPNLPIAMQEAGLINSIAYSLWLNDLDASTGNILFGGVDTGKYIGELVKVEVLIDQEINDYSHFTISMSSLEATSPTGTDVLTSPDAPIEVVLDSGTTLTYLPNEMAHKVWKEVGAEYQEVFGLAVLPCSHGLHPGYFEFGFAGPGGPRIDIGMDELVVDLTGGSPPFFASGPYEGEHVCAFGIQNYTNGPYTLGDTFLRSAYVVYDLENHEVGLAATNFNSTDTEIVAFESKGADMPSGVSATSHGDATKPVLPSSTELIAASGFQQEDYNGGDDEDEDGSLAVAAHSSPRLLVTTLTATILMQQWMSIIYSYGVL